MSLIILAGSFGLVAFKTFHLKYYESHFAFYQNTTYVYSMCLNRLSKEEYFYSKLSEFSVGIWIPIFVIASVYISMYSHLKKKARKRKSSSTQDSTVQMQQILRTFLITVFAFFLCLLPMTIFQTVSAHQKWYQSSKYYFLSHVFGTIANMNSALNPLIYSKMYLRIYQILRQLLASICYFCCKSRRIVECCFRSSPSRNTSQTTMININTITACNSSYDRKNIRRISAIWSNEAFTGFGKSNIGEACSRHPCGIQLSDMSKETHTNDIWCRPWIIP